MARVAGCRTPPRPMTIQAPKRPDCAVTRRRSMSAARNRYDEESSRGDRLTMTRTKRRSHPELLLGAGGPVPFLRDVQRLAQAPLGGANSGAWPPTRELYAGLGGYFCRACVGNPPYTSQRLGANGRAYYRACKLRLRLNGQAQLQRLFRSARSECIVEPISGSGARACS